MIKKLLSLFLLVTSISFGQNKIMGIIIDKTNNTPLPYVTIHLKNKKQQKTAVTDFDGNFIIDGLPFKRYTLVIEYIGYKTIIKPILFKETNFIDLKSIALEEDAQVLDAVVIRAETSTVTQKIDRIVVNVGKDLTSIGTDAASVLNNVQSVSVDDQTGELSLRGNSNVTILIDGKPTNIPTDQLLKQLPANAIKNIELITNPSAKYNPEGNSGIINIELVKNSFKGFNGSINGALTYGRNLRGNAGANFNYKKGNVNWFGNYSFRGGKDDIIGELKRNNNRQDSYGLNNRNNHLLKFGTDIEFNDKTSLSAFTVQSYNQLNYNNNTRIFNIPVDTLRNNSVFDLERKPYMQTYDASIHHIFDEKKHTLDFGVTYSIRQAPEDSDWSDSVVPEDKSQNYQEKIDVDHKRWRINLDYAKPINDDISIETGLEYRTINTHKFNQSDQQVRDSIGEFTERGLTSFDFNRDIYSAYANYRHQINKLGLQVGLRAEFYDLEADFTTQVDDQKAQVNDEVFSLYPSFFATYELTDKDKLQFSYSRRVDRPSIRQLNPIRTWGTPLIISQGNPNLEQQFTNSFELRYSTDTNLGNVSITGFYRIINNFMSRTLREDELIDQRLILSYGNFDTTDNYGLELAGYLKFYKWWKMNASADAYFQEQQGIVNLVPTTVNNLLFNLRMGNSFTLNKNLSLQWNTLYRGEDKNVQRVREAMFLMGLSGSYKVLDGNGTVTLGVSDIFNTFRARFNVDNPIEQRGEFNWESQRVTLGFTYNFGEQFKRKKHRRPGEDREAGGDVF